MSRRLLILKRQFSAVSSNNLEFNDQIRAQTEKMVARKQIERHNGRFQTWKEPIYRAPHQHIFETSPDYSFIDGRPVHVTSQKQLDFKLDQIRLAKKIVGLLKESNEVKEMYKKEVESREKHEKEKLERRPMAKGEAIIC